MCLTNRELQVKYQLGSETQRQAYLLWLWNDKNIGPAVLGVRGCWWLRITTARLGLLSAALTPPQEEVSGNADTTPHSWSLQVQVHGPSFIDVVSWTWSQTHAEEPSYGRERERQRETSPPSKGPYSQPTPLESNSNPASTTMWPYHITE